MGEGWGGGGGACKDPLERTREKVRARSGAGPVGQCKILGLAFFFLGGDDDTCLDVTGRELYDPSNGTQFQMDGLVSIMYLLHGK